MQPHADPKVIVPQTPGSPYNVPHPGLDHVCTAPIYPTWREKFDDAIWLDQDIPRWLIRFLTCEILAPVSDLLREISKIDLDAADDYQMHLEAATTFAAMRLTRAIPRDITSIDDIAQRMLVGAGLCCPELLREFLLEDALHRGTLSGIRLAIPDFDPAAYVDSFYPLGNRGPESHGERSEPNKPTLCTLEDQTHPRVEAVLPLEADYEVINDTAPVLKLVARVGDARVPVYIVAVDLEAITSPIRQAVDQATHKVGQQLTTAGKVRVSGVWNFGPDPSIEVDSWEVVRE